VVELLLLLLLLMVVKGRGEELVEGAASLCARVQHEVVAKHVLGRRGKLALVAFQLLLLLLHHLLGEGAEGRGGPLLLLVAVMGVGEGVMMMVAHRRCVSVGRLAQLVHKFGRRRGVVRRRFFGQQAKRRNLGNLGVVLLLLVLLLAKLVL
jgi:hypothetical protein